jgi:ribosome maturation factor RimP
LRRIKKQLLREPTVPSFFSAMALSQTEQIIQDKLDAFFLEEGRESHFLVHWSLTGKKIEVFIDSDTGVTFDLCKSLSRSLEGLLDENKILGEDYLLEVSSAGVGRPLLLPRQYKKNIDRFIQVTLKNAEVLEGKIIAADNLGFTIEWEAKEKQGKKNVKVIHRRALTFDESAKSVIKISV